VDDAGAGGAVVDGASRVGEGNGDRPAGRRTLALRDVASGMEDGLQDALELLEEVAQELDE
jgi:hypothetical protein